MFKSTGLKRYIASLLTIIIPIIAGIPALAWTVPYLQAAAGGVGIAGLANATAVGNLKGINTANITSALAIILATATQIPALAPYLWIIQAVAALFGVASVAGGKVK